MLCDTIVDAIGNTPLVRLHLESGAASHVYGKLELLNPFGMKDRVAKQCIIEAKRNGMLRDGAPIIESSSGTMALGVGLVGTYLGHEVHIVTDPRMDPITLAKLRTIGCTIHIVQKMTACGWQSARLERLAELMQEYPGAFWPRQYDNPANPRAYSELARELLRDLDRVDILVGSVGSGGSLCGTARELRKTNPNLRVVAVDAVGSVIFGQPDRPGRLQGGLGNSLLPANVDRSLVDEIHWLSDEEAFAATLALARDEKIFAGNSSGSVYAVARWLSRMVASDTRIVAIFADRGDRYFNTIYDEHFRTEKEVDRLFIPGTPREVSPDHAVTSWSFARLKAEGSNADHLLFIEANTTGSGMLALQKARLLGFTPLFATSDPQRYRGLDNIGCQLMICDTNSVDAIRRAIEASGYVGQLRGITTTSEFYVEIAAQLAADYQLPGNAPQSIGLCRNKARTRQRLAAAGIRQPAFTIVSSTAELRRALGRVGLPCVVKPVDDTGSNEVLLCRTASEAEHQARRILSMYTNVRGQSTARTILLEEFLDAPEFSVEMFSWQGETVCVGITEKSMIGLPYFVEQRHIFPARLSPDAADAIERTVRLALEAVGVTHGATHTEVKLTPQGCAIVEINARLAGGMIPDLIHIATGIDMIEQQLKSAAGERPELQARHRGYAGIQFLVAAAQGRLEDIAGVEAAQALAGVAQVTLTATPGSLVSRPRNAYDRLGYIIAGGQTYEDVGRTLREAAALISVSVAAERGGGRETPVGIRALVSYQ